MGKGSAQRHPKPPRFVSWLSVTYAALPRPLKFVVWVLVIAAVHAAGLMPSVPHLPPWL